ncbi:MAG: hypothetical protein A3J09_01815 [Candidatus Zambryskibacteria bacterium RIFCSPLOWO2_02_FULL_51_21]|nr:MAG: hypothetical protein A2723_01815 [Candidatus Zambryskibacteria bacterium RIFCSPHIGHO2_01_FULL_52_18]OHB07233.1 MAG: hypothetical protein A2944_01555 [Candidatus Zambryskibacteria bacterium RIFCSPLOWO2_01_FULL_52_12]OHB11273.1 MAG: hypothetical protein A3J09_01815 [Candidatus Zambryskibacteria bacterium RIFCSPLOWO2_02_FULL_51_21]
MRILTFFIKSLTGFLFPKKPEILVLESLPTDKLLAKLPRATDIEEKDVIALFDYSHPLVKEIIWEVKYGGNTVLAAKLGEILYDTIVAELGERNALDTEHRALLMPMPVSGKRRYERGWNQAELLAQAVKDCDEGLPAGRQGRILKYVTGQLVKTRHTESQTRTSSKSERMKNLSDSMKILNPSAVLDRFVVLIDDVTTTGATFAEARCALKAAGAKKIICIAVAH